MGKGIYSPLLKKIYDSCRRISIDRQNNYCRVWQICYDFDDLCLSNPLKSSRNKVFQKRDFPHFLG
jgi:hypothetical protein